MSKGLEALNEIKDFTLVYYDEDGNEEECTKLFQEMPELFEVIEKELKDGEKYKKALEIIVTKYVDLQCLFCVGYKEYNFHRDRKFHVSKEEFDLLKEALENGN